MNERGERFSDERARAILARAIELDAQAPTTSAEELRTIAAEIGISPAALEAALAEQETALESRREIGGRRTATVVSALGLPLGMAAGSVIVAGSLGLSGFVALSSISAAGLVASGVLVVAQGATGTLRSFQLRNLAFWGGLATGSVLAILLVGGGPSSVPVSLSIGAVMWCARRWMTSSIMGSAAVIALRKARQSRDTAADPTDSDARGGRRKSVTVRAFEWLRRTLRPWRTRMQSAPVEHLHPDVSPARS